MQKVEAIILFDGVCNLCNGSVQFILKRDKKNYFQFASLQSDFGQKTLSENQLPSDDFKSLLLLENGKLYQSSTAALRIARKLDGGWPLFYGLVIVPRFIRNFIYQIIAKNRYRWFGKQESCMIPTPEYQARFIQ